MGIVLRMHTPVPPETPTYRLKKQHYNLGYALTLRLRPRLQIFTHTLMSGTKTFSTRSLYRPFPGFLGKIDGVDFELNFMLSFPCSR